MIFFSVHLRVHYSDDFDNNLLCKMKRKNDISKQKFNKINFTLQIIEAKPTTHSFSNIYVYQCKYQSDCSKTYIKRIEIQSSSVVDWHKSRTSDQHWGGTQV